MQTIANRARVVSFTAAPTIVCYHAFCNLQIPVTPWPRRQDRTQSPPDDASLQPASGGMTPPPPEFRFLRTLPGRLFLLSGGLLLLLLAIRYFIPLPPFLEVFRKVASIALI